MQGLVALAGAAALAPAAKWTAPPVAVPVTPDGFHAAGLTRMTVPSGMGGNYLISATAIFTGDEDRPRDLLAWNSIAVNGIPRFHSLQATALDDQTIELRTDGLVYLKAGDYVEPHVSVGGEPVRFVATRL